METWPTMVRELYAIKVDSGVVTCMLFALSTLSILGARYPAQSCLCFRLRAAARRRRPCDSLKSNRGVESGPQPCREFSVPVDEPLSTAYGADIV